ncbi:MAG: DUF3244 domain-containing protein [Bacteroidaceae bacterium]|nr:DUF3244 domain-containing protein [Bacteroidaceae bacterium]
MKKYLLTFAAMLFCMTSNVSAVDKVVFKKKTSIIRPKSPQLHPISIAGEYDADELTIDFVNYDGGITITVVDASTHQVVSVENETIFSPETVSVDLSTLPSSTYYIFIELDNGDCYYASIQI